MEEKHSLPEDWDVILCENGRAYHRTDDGMVFHSYLCMPGMVINESAIKARLSCEESDVIVLTHHDFAEIMRLAYQLFKENGNVC